MDNQPTWHLIHAKPRQEIIACEHLEKQGYKTYLPLIKQPSHAQSPATPLFPRYLFIRLTAGLDNWTPIRSTRGVSSLVRVGINPAEIPDQLIDNIKKRADSDGLHRVPPKNLSKGDRIRVLSGPLMGYEAIFSEQRAEHRAIILLNLIGKQNRIEVPTEIIVQS